MSEVKANFVTMREVMVKAASDTWPRVTFNYASRTIDVWMENGDEGKREPYWIDWNRIDHRPVHDEARAQRLKAIDREHEECARCTHLQCRAGICPMENQ